MKELARTTEAIVVVNERWRKLNANMHQYVPFRANIGQYLAVQTMPWCSLADAKELL